MSVGSNITQITIKDLESGTDYTVYVYAKIEDQLSKPATMKFTTLLPNPGEIQIERNNPRMISFSWAHEKENRVMKERKNSLEKQLFSYKIVCSCMQGGVEYSSQSTNM